LPPHFADNETTTPLLTTFGCVLMERDTGKSCIYTAVNLKTGKRAVISRRPTPLTTSGVEAMVEKIRQSSVAGAGVYEADRSFGDDLAIENCRTMLNAVFNEILPKYSYAIRAEQISLAEHILDTIHNRFITLAESEVGTGKTLAYLVPALIAKRGRLNGLFNLSFYTGSPYVEAVNMPIVVATSSIALQKALITDYIPELSRILLANGVIKAPLTAVIRKGREHYVCEHNLRTHMPFEHDTKMKNVLEGLTEPNAQIDLAEIDGLTTHCKRKICVPDRCYKNCTHRSECRYIRFREAAGSSAIDIQVCNHNYLLADTLRRKENKQPLVPNYQAVIIDEAHKFLGAARSMYGAELSSLTLPDIKDVVFGINLKNAEANKIIRKTALKLSRESTRLFLCLAENTTAQDEEESDRFSVRMDERVIRHIANLHKIADALADILAAEPLSGQVAGRKTKVLWELEQAKKQTAMLSNADNLICWLETDRDENHFCAIPKDLNEQLHKDLWGKGIPTVLTSGTLSANGDFAHIKRTLGLDRTLRKLTETSKPSPFDFQANALLYISENVPFPDRSGRDYILSVANEVEELIRASHGHAAVLFTSYKVMDMVCEHLAERGLPFPMFRLNKGGVKEIERFKKSGNGILFAAGALWEGIDIPGDALSMLIIIKLPFAVPDPISEYEQTLYADMDEYKEKVIVPEMIIKLKQGFGRLIRTETDTGVVAILDSRVSKSGSYRQRVLDALPDCRITSEISAVEDFMAAKKPSKYFE
jgi:ATP-dependent DNA helicase DinG